MQLVLVPASDVASFDMPTAISALPTTYPIACSWAFLILCIQMVLNLFGLLRNAISLVSDVLSIQHHFAEAVPEQSSPSDGSLNNNIRCKLTHVHCLNFLRSDYKVHLNPNCETMKGAPHKTRAVCSTCLRQARLKLD